MFDDTTTKNKSKKTSNNESSGLSSSPDALLSMLMRNQYRQNDNWKPSIVNFQPNGIPQIQTQLAGTYTFNTVAPQYIAPGYEHLRDLSIQKDLEGKQNKSVWDRFRSQLAGIDVAGLDPSYQGVMDNINLDMNKYDADLRQGKWSDNQNLVSDFVSDITNKKGLNDILGVLNKVGEQKQVVKDLVGEYDPKTLTGGIAPEDVKFYNDPKNLGRFNPAIALDNNEYGGGIGFSPNTIFTARNIPKEVQDATDKMLANKSYVTDANGLRTYQLGNDALQFGLKSNEGVSADRVRELVENQLATTGAKEYIERKAEILAYNQMKQIDTTTPEGLSAVKDIVAQLASQEKNPKGIWSNLLKKDDRFLSANAENILRESNRREFTNNIFQGALARSAYNKEDISVFTNKLLEEQMKAEAKDKENKSKEDQITYSLDYGSAGLVQALDTQGLNTIDTNIKSLTSQLNNLTVQLNSTQDKNNPNYILAMKNRDNIKKQLQDANTEASMVTKNFEKLSGDAGISMKQVYDLVKRNNNISYNDFKLKFGQLITSYIDGKPIDSTKLGLSSVDLKNSPYASNFNNAYEINQTQGTNPLNGAGMSISEDKSKGSLNRLAGRIASKWKQQNPNKSKIDVVNDIAIIKGIQGDTEKNPDSKRFANVYNSLNTMAKSDYNTLQVSVNGAKPKGVIAQMSEEYGVDINEISNGIDLSRATMSPSSYQTGTAKQKGKTMYFWQVPIKDDEKNEVAQKLLKKTNGSTMISIPVVLPDSIDRQKSEELAAAFAGIYKNRLNASSPLGTTFEQTKNSIGLGFANATGLGKIVDDMNLYGLDTSSSARLRPNGLKTSQKITKVQGNELLIEAHSDIGATTPYDKSFSIKVKNGNDWTGYYENVNTGERTSLSDSQIANMSPNEKNKWVLHQFDTDTDVKAFISRGYLDSVKDSENFNKGGGGNSVLERIATRESSGGKVTGYHNGGSSAYGKYGFLKEWFPRMSKHFGLSEDAIRKRPDLIDQYANTEYKKIAQKEINPVYNKLYNRLSRIIPDFNMDDAMSAWHYVGLGYLTDIAEGRTSINQAPPGNKQSVYNYIMKVRKNS